MYIASDGPREDRVGEREIVMKIRRRILDLIDWTCEVKTLFREINLGCSQGVFTAINWLFENEKLGIILEDDCVISETFYPYMCELLCRYEHDLRIGMIAGTNPCKIEATSSYFFSRFKSCWGWGTWKRAWTNMDLSMSWRDYDYDSIIYNSGFGGHDAAYWKWEIEYIDKSYVSAWDWQWYFSLAAQNQLCIYPSKNQVTNIGNVENATHKPAYNISYEAYKLTFPLIHPKSVVPYFLFEKTFYKRNFTIKRRIGRSLPYKIKKIIKSIFY